MWIFVESFGGSVVSAWAFEGKDDAIRFAVAQAARLGYNESLALADLSSDLMCEMGGTRYTVVFAYRGD